MCYDAGRPGSARHHPPLPRVWAVGVCATVPARGAHLPDKGAEGCGVIDKGRLLSWLDARAGGLVAQSVYQGLATRIRRGDFDAEEEAES